MNTELAIPEMNTGIAVNVTEDAFKSLASSSKFLPRLTLTSSQSGPVMDNLIAPGRWGIINGKNVTDLGVETRGYICGLRLKAMDTGADPIVSYYDPTKPEFQKIQERSLVEDQGPLAGPEFLVYIPTEKMFCTFYMCSKTMRREAPTVRQLLRRAATFKITLIQNKKNKWHGPVITACSVELAPPNPEELQKVLHAFLNPADAAVEQATDADKAATSRDR